MIERERERERERITTKECVIYGSRKKDIIYIKKVIRNSHKNKGGEKMLESFASPTEVHHND